MDRFVLRPSVRRVRAVVAASALLAAARLSPAQTLTWDASGTNPTAPVDGSGTWDDSTPLWSNGSSDQAWTDGNNAVIGSGNGTSAYTITLGANISTGSITFQNAGTGSYTIDGGYNFTTNVSGYSLATTTGGWNISGAKVTLTNGVFVDGTALPTSTATSIPNVTNNGTFTLGPGSYFESVGIFGDSTGNTPNNSNVYFNGGTFVPYVQQAPSSLSFVATVLYGTGHAYISTGGLTVNTSLVDSTYAYAEIDDPLLHDPKGAATDGGLTITGGSFIFLGFSEYGSNPVSTYNGLTNVSDGVLVLDTSGNTEVTSPVGALGTGPLPNSNYLIGANGELLVAATDALVGEKGTQTVDIEGGYLEAVADVAGIPTSTYIGNTILNGGVINSDAQSSFEFLANTQLHVIGNSILAAATVGFETGANISIDAGKNLTVYSNLVDASAPGTSNGVGQLTLNGLGTLDLVTPLDSSNVVENTFQGPVTINGGTLVLDTGGSTTGMFPDSSLITINTGGVLELGQSNTLVGTFNNTIGSVVINGGGELIAAPGTFNHINNLTLNGGTILSVGPANASGGVVFLPTAHFNITDDSIIRGPGVVIPTGVNVNISSGTTLAVYGTLVDSSSSYTGQLTITGGGTVKLYGSNTYSGPTNVSSGNLLLQSTGILTKTPSISVSAGSSFVDAGAITSTPAVAVKGVATFGPNFNTGIGLLSLTSLTVGPNSNSTSGLVTLATAASHGNRLLLVTGALSLSGTTNAWTSKLDLTNNDLDIQHGNLANTFNQLKAGYNNGNWNGAHGIVSSAAATDSTYLTTLGVIVNTANGTTPLYGSGGTLGNFDGISPVVTDVLVKYTYYGDTDLNGKVDGSDYSRVDNAFSYNSLHPTTPLTGWFNGDFNYDGVINGSDYTLIDNAFNRQGTSLAAQVATQIAPLSSAVPEPTTLGLLGIGAISLLARRRRVAQS
jgi:autotransporter-associated beta strand protein